MNEDIVTAITKIGNARLHKRHPDISIQEWQTKEVLEALALLQLEWENVRKNTRREVSKT